ncbi:hypothetical protein NON20_05320 [Synechocystis sp. B12]|nr:hypothetical protein NON20_05320 [Synechocystis sp. B12]
MTWFNGQRNLVKECNFFALTTLNSADDIAGIKANIIPGVGNE